MLDNVKELGGVGTMVAQQVLTAVTPESKNETEFTKNTVSSVNSVTAFMQNENPQPIPNIAPDNQQRKKYMALRQALNNDLTAQFKNNPNAIKEKEATASITQYLLSIQSEFLADELTNPASNPIYIKMKCELIDKAISDLNKNVENSPPSQRPEKISEILVTLENGLSNDALSKNSNPLQRTNSLSTKMT